MHRSVLHVTVTSAVMTECFPRGALRRDDGMAWRDAFVWTLRRTETVLGLGLVLL